MDFSELDQISESDMCNALGIEYIQKDNIEEFTFVISGDKLVEILTCFFSKIV